MRDWTKSKSWKRGQDTENGRFLRVFSLVDDNPRKATMDDQMKHIDWHTLIGTIDVKAMKRVNRGGDLQTEFMWIEFRNRAGTNGWIFGKQDWIAFEMLDGFLLARTKDLRDLANELCNTDVFVQRACDALYKAYQRKGNSDIISMIKFSDLDKIPHMYIRDSDYVEVATPSPFL